VFRVTACTGSCLKGSNYWGMSRLRYNQMYCKLCIYCYECTNLYKTNKYFIYIYFYSNTNQMHQCLKFILFSNDTLHVSDGLSVHHQEFKTVHTATGICQRDSAVCLLGSRQQYLFGCCMYSLELLMMDGKTVRNM